MIGMCTRMSKRTYTLRPPTIEAYQLDTNNKRSLQEIFLFIVEDEERQKESYSFACDHWGKPWLFLDEFGMHNGDYIYKDFCGVKVVVKKEDFERMYQRYEY